MQAVAPRVSLRFLCGVREGPQLAEWVEGIHCGICQEVPLPSQLAHCCKEQHLFCSPCLKLWGKKECPLCRSYSRRGGWNDLAVPLRQLLSLLPVNCIYPRDAGGLSTPGPPCSDVHTYGTIETCGCASRTLTRMPASRAGAGASLLRKKGVSVAKRPSVHDPLQRAKQRLQTLASRHHIALDPVVCTSLAHLIPVWPYLDKKLSSLVKGCFSEVYSPTTFLQYALEGVLLELTQRRAVCQLILKELWLLDGRDVRWWQLGLKSVLEWMALGCALSTAEALVALTCNPLSVRNVEPGRTPEELRQEAIFGRLSPFAQQYVRTVAWGEELPLHGGVGGIFAASPWFESLCKRALPPDALAGVARVCHEQECWGVFMTLVIP